MSEKNLDAHGRLRSRTVAFRMSPEEADLLDRLVAISGLTKQDYITNKLLDRTVTVLPSSRMQKGMEETMLLIYRELLCVASADELQPELIALIDSVSNIYANFSENVPDVRLASDESVILSLKRES